MMRSMIVCAVSHNNITTYKAMDYLTNKQAFIEDCLHNYNGLRDMKQAWLEQFRRVPISVMLIDEHFTIDTLTIIHN